MTVYRDPFTLEEAMAEIRALRRTALRYDSVVKERDSLHAALADRDAKLAALKQESIESAKMTILLTEDLQYIAGIVAKGRGQPTIQDNLGVRSVVLGYVQELEAKLKALEKQEPFDWIKSNKEADAIVRSKPTWKRFIDGTPLSNDISVWMANFAESYAAAGAAPVPEGWKLVPMEPTPEMWAASSGPNLLHEYEARYCYKAMLAAAPKEPSNGPQL